MKVIPHCMLCEPTADAAIMGDELEATCAHCGALVTRERTWKDDGAGIVKGKDVYRCTPPDELPPAPTQTPARA